MVVVREEKMLESVSAGGVLMASKPPMGDADKFYGSYSGASFNDSFDPDNIAIDKHPIYSGSFLVSFMVDARGGAMRGCRHSGVRIIVPPGKASMPTRVTCKLVKKEKLVHPPPLMEGEALASRLLEMGPTGAKFSGPVIIEVPHFASLREKEREIVILRSDNGETWREHQIEATEEAVTEALNGSFDGEDLESAEELYQKRITRILTSEFPQYFAVVTRTRQETKSIGPDSGMLSSTVVPQVQAVFPDGALTKKIKVGLQAQPVSAELVSKMLGNRVAVSPIVTVEPRRRKFHKPITLTIPLPKAAGKGMINSYSAETPTLRLLCSITGGTSPAQWEDITGTTPLSFVNDCVSFTTTVSARFWLMDCQNVNETSKMATDLYREAISVPFMAKFVVFAKQLEGAETRLRLFCMTDDKMDKTLENQEQFREIARSKDVEVLEGKPQYVEMAGNLVPVTKSGDQLYINFNAFRENRLPFSVRVRDSHQEPAGRVAFMREPKVARGEAPQHPICNLNIQLPEGQGYATYVASLPPSAPDHIEAAVMADQRAELVEPVSEVGDSQLQLQALEEKLYQAQQMPGSPDDQISKAELRLTDIADAVGPDWVVLGQQLGIQDNGLDKIRQEYNYVGEQALVMLHLWVQQQGMHATGNQLERALRKVNREDVITKCMYNVEEVTDDLEKTIAKDQIEQAGFEDLNVELELEPSVELEEPSADELNVELEEPSADDLNVELEEPSADDLNVELELEPSAPDLPGVSASQRFSLDVSYDEQDLMKESESAEASDEYPDGPRDVPEDKYHRHSRSLSHEEEQIQPQKSERAQTIVSPTEEEANQMAVDKKAAMAFLAAQLDSDWVPAHEDEEVTVSHETEAAVEEAPVYSERRDADHVAVDDLIERVESATVEGMDDRISLSSDDDDRRETEVHEPVLAAQTELTAESGVTAHYDVDMGLNYDTQADDAELVITHPVANGSQPMMEGTQWEVVKWDTILGDIAAVFKEGDDHAQYSEMLSDDGDHMMDVAVGGEMSSARLVMRRQVHSTTLLRDGHEETKVTRDDQVEEIGGEAGAPRALRRTMQDIIDDFMEDS